MASPLYNDKTLAAQEQKRKLGVTVEQPDVAAGDYVQDPSADQLLADAHASLDSANQFGADNNTERLAKLPDSLNALKDQVTDKRGTLRKITEPLAGLGNGVATVGMLAALPQPLVGGAMMTGGGLAAVPDYLRRMISPEEGESRPGLAETGFTGLALSPLGSLRGLKNVAQEARTGISETDALSSAWAAAHQVPYRAGSGAAVDGARGVEQAEANRLVREMRKAGEPKQRPIDAFYASDPAAKYGGEGRMTGQFQEGSGGLSDLRAGLIKPNANPTIEGKPVADRLAELSTKVSPRRQEELTQKFGGRPKGESAESIMGRRRKDIDQSETFHKAMQVTDPWSARFKALRGAAAEPGAPMDPAAALASRFGLPSDAEMAASILKRNATGGWK